MTGVRVTVFEVVNELAKEIFVGLAPAGVDEAYLALRAAPPRVIAHWDFAKLPDGSLRVVESSLEADGAADFVATYSKTDLPDGWRYLSEPF